MVSCHQSFGPARIHPSSDGANLAWRTSRVGVRRAGAAPKMAMCQTIHRRMTDPMGVCSGSMLLQNAHKDFTTYHVRRMIVRSLSDPEPALGGRDRHEKMPSWLTSGFMDDSLRRSVYTHECEPSSYSTLGMWVHLRACVGSGGFPHRGIVCTHIAHASAHRDAPAGPAAPVVVQL